MTKTVIEKVQAGGGTPGRTEPTHDDPVTDPDTDPRVHPETPQPNEPEPDEPEHDRPEQGDERKN
ncbi:hypothetical protein [Mumia sp. ZJ430]|uniref:hypothetical protein n=1 Tax=Mumia sp. ZJ430 TaxID=2708083 RepID=UPI00142225AA|nr:hypothetical protein [Mumia sp. ZJ430]